MPPKPGEKKRSRVSSSEEEKSSHVLIDDAILKDLQAKLDKLNVLDQINERLIRIENDISTVKGKVAQLEDGLNYTNSELAETKGKLEEKAEKDKLKNLEREMEDLRNRSRRNNLVFYNIPEKAEGQDCVAFIKGFINIHMGLEALCGDVEIERAHRTPTKVPGNNNKKPRPVHVAFLRYTDKVKILSNAAARLKDNPYQGNLIGIGADFAKETQERRKALIPFKKHLQSKLGRERKVFIAYPAILKYLDENGKPKIVRDEDFKKLKGEMQEEEGQW